MTESDSIRAAFERAAELFRRIADEKADEIALAAVRIREALAAGHHVFAFGNGGSATDAQHFAAELVGRFRTNRRGLRATALTADQAVLTSIANDFGYEQVFARQLEALGARGDVAVAITTSGASKNVNAALEFARTAGLVTIGLTGRDGGATSRLVDVHINVPDTETARVQEAHRVMLHVICELVERGMADA